MSGDDVLLGDEIEVESFKRDPFDNIVKFEPLALFGPAGPNGNTVTVGVHDSSNPTDRTVVGVGPNNQNQLLLPTFTGTGATDLPDTFGFDFTWHGLSDRVTSSEDARNTWSPGAQHKVRVYPLKNADGSVEPYAYVIAPEDVPTGVDFQDAVMIVRNVQPVDHRGQRQHRGRQARAGVLRRQGHHVAEQSVKVTNTGSTPLVISSVTLAGTNPGDFTLTGGTPGTLPGRRQRDVRRDLQARRLHRRASAPPCCASPPTTRTRLSSTSASTAWRSTASRAATSRRSPTSSAPSAATSTSAGPA